MSAPAVSECSHGLGQHVHLFKVDQPRTIQQRPIPLVGERHICRTRINKYQVLGILVVYSCFTFQEERHEWQDGRRELSNGYPVSPMIPRGLNQAVKLAKHLPQLERHHFEHSQSVQWR